METNIMLLVRRIVLTSLVAVLLTALSVRSAVAAFGITSVSGANELLSPPLTDVQPGTVEGALPVVFHEVINGVVLTPAGMPVDHDGSNVVASPTISGNVVNPALISTTLPAGTQFNSYMFHFDPAGSPFFAFYVTTINFDNPIIGVQLFSNGFELEKPSGTAYVGALEAGDSEVLNNNGPDGVPILLRPTYYPSGVDFRGLEEDAFVLTISGNTVNVAGSAHGDEIDQIRIFTAPSVSTGIPEPATAASWAIISGIGMTGAFLWRRQNSGRSI